MRYFKRAARYLYLLVLKQSLFFFQFQSALDLVDRIVEKSGEFLIVMKVTAAKAHDTYVSRHDAIEALN